MPDHNPGHILLVDDNPYNLEGLASYLESRGWIVYKALDATAARRLAETRSFDAAVIDIVLPAEPGQKPDRGQSLGLGLARWLKQTQPQVGVVVLSAYEDRGYEFLDLAQAGHRGLVYLVKGALSGDLLRAIEDAQRGEVRSAGDVITDRIPVDAFLGRLDVTERSWVIEAAAQLDRLTPRELEVAWFLAAARDVESVAATLGIAPKTVANYVTSIYDKLGLAAMSQADSGLRPSIILSKALLLAELRGMNRP